MSSSWLVTYEGRHFAVYLFAHTTHSQKAGPFSVARLKMDLPFHDRLAYNRVHRRSTSSWLVTSTPVETPIARTFASRIT